MNDDTNGSGSRKATRRGYMLGFTDDHGFGVYAMRTYRAGEIVMVAGNGAKPGHLRVPRQAAGASVDMFSRVNRSSAPNCGIHVTATGARDLVARHLIVPGAELTC